MAAVNADKVYATYTRDGATTGTHTVLVDKDWFARPATETGLTAFTPGLPRLLVQRLNLPRRVLLIDSVTGRRTTRIAGTATASCLADGYTVALPTRGSATAVTYTFKAILKEHIRRGGPIVAAPPQP